MSDQFTNKPIKRNIMEPPTSTVLLGPREGFIENIADNLGLIKKRLTTKDLKIIDIEVGKYTKTRVSILYLNTIADIKIVKKIVNKIKQINIDAILDSYYLVSFLEERPNSIFKQVGQTEKPDALVSKLLEGRVAILTDGSPIALTLPFILIEDLHSPDDYYQKSFRVSFVRLVRLIGVFAAVLLPGFYLAIELYHYKIIPLNLLVTLSNATANLPFGPLLEMLFVIILFEILYEANARMPRYLGMALSIVGALILGDTAVKAGLVSSPAVMIVALSGITIYTVPNEAGQLSLLRLGFTLAGGMMSFYGIVILLVFLIFYLANFNSYGSPYLAPMAPFIYGDQKDAIVKSPITKMKNRPISILNKNKVRLKN
ncbi:MAG: spore germination protein [Clostridia bacterium]|nr:spore germination protein [Clostridia bacterium]